MNESCHIWMNHVTMNASYRTEMSHVTHVTWSTSHFDMPHLSFWHDSPADESRQMVMWDMNESYRIWMSHITYEWVISQVSESNHIRMSHFTYEWVTSHTKESYHIWMSHVTHERVISHMNESRHIWMSHISHMNESCHIWMSHVTHEWSHMNESYHVTTWYESVHEWVMSHINESCHIWMCHVSYEWVISHMNESHITHEWVISRNHKPCQIDTTHLPINPHAINRVCIPQKANRYNFNTRKTWTSHIIYEWAVPNRHDSPADKPTCNKSWQ